MEGLNHPAPIAGPAGYGRTSDCGRLGGEFDGGGAGPADGGSSSPAAPGGAAGVTAFLDTLHAQGGSLDGSAAPAPAAIPPAAPAGPPVPGVVPAPAAPGVPGTAPAPAGVDPNGTAAPAPGPIPYPRFQEVVTQRNQLEQQLAPWQPTLQALQAAGLDPQTALQRLVNPPAPAPTAEQLAAQHTEAFHQSLLARGLDPYNESMDRATYDSARALWDMQREAQATVDQLRTWQEQQQTALREQQEAAQLQQTVAGMQQELAAVVQAEPLFQDPTIGGQLQANVYALYALELEQGGPRTLTEIAQGVAGAQRAFQQQIVAQYAAGKQADAAAPVVTGGGAPAPVERTQVGSLSQTQRQDRVMGMLAGQLQTG